VSKDSRDRERAREQGRVILPGGAQASFAEEVAAQEALNVADSLCPVMSTTVFLPNPLTGAIEARGVNRPCHRQCMMYEAAPDNDRGACRLAVPTRTRIP